MASRSEKATCRVRGCTKEPNGSLGFCQACYVRTRYWEGKTLKQKVARLDQIGVWMNSLSDQCGSAVTHVSQPTRRRKRA